MANGRAGQRLESHWKATGKPLGRRDFGPRSPLRGSTSGALTVSLRAAATRYRIGSIRGRYWRVVPMGLAIGFRPVV